MAITRRKDTATFEYNEANMINAVHTQIDALCTSFETVIPNCFTQADSEADLFAIRRSGYCDEIEVKITKADFLNERNKVVMQDNLPKISALQLGRMTANYFWYVLKKDIVCIEDIPEFAGIVFIDDTGRLSVRRSPRLLHDRKLSGDDKYKFARKVIYRYWKFRKEQSNEPEANHAN